MTIDRSLLPSKSPFDLLDLESARIDAFLSDLGDDDPRWQGPTRCSEWDLRALLGHLRHLEDYNQACLDGRVRELLETMSGHDFDAFNAAGVEQYAGVPVGQVLEDWRRLSADFRSRMRERGDGVVDTSVGDYPALFQAFYLAVEYATHGDDLGATSQYDGRAAWRAAFARFALTEQEKPLHVEAREGSTLVTFEGRDYDVSDDDLAEAGAARLPTGHRLPAELRDALRCFA